MPQRGQVPVMMGLQGEEGFPHEGTINFVNNQVNPTTGSITWRGVFPNPKPPTGFRLLSPGMFVRMRLPIGKPHPAVLVIDSAVVADQGLKYVYVVDAKNTVQYRRVTTGPLESDGMRIIEDGLKTDDLVVVGLCNRFAHACRSFPRRFPCRRWGPPNRPRRPTMRNEHVFSRCDFCTPSRAGAFRS